MSQYHTTLYILAGTAVARIPLLFGQFKFGRLLKVLKLLKFYYQHFKMPFYSFFASRDGYIQSIFSPSFYCIILSEDGMINQESSF